MNQQSLDRVTKRTKGESIHTHGGGNFEGREFLFTSSPSDQEAQSRMADSFSSSLISIATSANEKNRTQRNSQVSLSSTTALVAAKAESALSSGNSGVLPDQVASSVIWSRNGRGHARGNRINRHNNSAAAASDFSESENKSTPAFSIYCSLPKRHGAVPCGSSIQSEDEHRSESSYGYFVRRRANAVKTETTSSRISSPTGSYHEKSDISSEQTVGFRFQSSDSESSMRHPVRVVRGKRTEDMARATHTTARKRAFKRAFRDLQHSITKCSDSKNEEKEEENGASSGSGTEGGYAGSASSNTQTQLRCYSDSSSDCSSTHKNGSRGLTTTTGYLTRQMLIKKEQSYLSMSSSVIADYSSGSSEDTTESYSVRAFCDESSPSPSDALSSSLSVNGLCTTDDQDETATERSDVKSSADLLSMQNKLSFQTKIRTECKAPIFDIGCDVMAHILTFLEPPEILSVMTAPLSKDWLSSFTRQHDLWRVLCLLEPFKAHVEDDVDDGRYEAGRSCPFDMQYGMRRTFGRYRLLYSGFVRCMRYLARIKDDAANGRSPSMEYATDFFGRDIGNNESLRVFLSRARGVVHDNGTEPVMVHSSDKSAEVLDEKSKSPIYMLCSGKRKTETSDEASTKKRRFRYGHSKLTQRLLGPSASGDAGDVNLPWSCAVYSIVNWMTAFADVEGIQIMCLKVLPPILENEQQRITAQRAGLTDMVLRSMVLFPDSAELHTAAFHAIVLLARPLGGQEGMLFHTSMVSSSGILSSPIGGRDGRNGIAVMLDSMKRFAHDGVLQAMSCWSLVNVALSPEQKRMLVRLGGIQAATNAMMLHPHNPEVQFRGLFALVNLVIPTSAGDTDATTATTIVDEDSSSPSSESDNLDEMVDQIGDLVVASMRNFFASEAILNRACLVLHNLSLTPEYHRALLRTPSCYQMLEWSLANYRTDPVLQQSAAGTLHRLQMTLSSNQSLRLQFAASLYAQRQQSLEQAHREAIELRDQEEHLAMLAGNDGDEVSV